MLNIINLQYRCYKPEIKFLKIAMLLLVFHTADAQLPRTLLYMGDIKYPAQQPGIKNLKLLSGFNPDGYTNQPQFFNYNELYVSASIDTQKFTDIYKLNLRDYILTRFTDTYGISEFSPTPVPASDDLSVIRIESDGKTQSLWIYPKDASSKGKRLFKDLNNPGYHFWLSSSDVVLFLVGEPHKLAVGNIHSGKIQVITENPGRCFKKSNDGKLLFVHKDQLPWTLKAFDPSSFTIQKICELPVNSEDFEVLANGTIICASDSKILYCHPEKNPTWQTAEDFSSSGIKGISRIAVMRDRIVFVSNAK